MSHLHGRVERIHVHVMDGTGEDDMAGGTELSAGRGQGELWPRKPRRTSWYPAPQPRGRPPGRWVGSPPDAASPVHIEALGLHLPEERVTSLALEKRIGPLERLGLSPGRLGS